MLLDFDHGGRAVKNVPYRSQFNQWKQRLTPTEIADIKSKIHRMLDSAEVHTTSWMPGSNWGGTPFDPIYWNATKRSETSFAIFLTGDSKKGKSTVTVVAGSVIGLGTEDDLPNFRTTDPAFGELPQDFNDFVIPLNEFGLLRGSASERRQRQRELAYGFAEGRGTTYSKHGPIEKSNKDVKWHSIIIANGEETSDELAMHAGEIRWPARFPAGSICL